MTVKTHVPERTCIGCREKAPRQALLRLRLSEDGTVVPDPKTAMTGRGAWIHPDLECLNLAERRRAFGRAFRVSTPLDVSLLRARIGHPTVSETDCVTLAEAEKMQKAGRKPMGTR